MGKLKSMSDIEADRKPKLKTKENKPKEIETMNKKHIIITIALTLTLLAALVGMFALGISYERGINNRVNSEVKTFVSAIKPKK